MAIINQQNFQIKSGNAWYKLCPFPVGFIYLSQNSTSPATTFGGTWAALNEDRFLRPSNAWTTGGSKKISTEQLPSHNHTNASGTWIGYWGSNSSDNHISSQGSSSGWGLKGDGSWTTSSITDTYTGGGQGLLAAIPRLLRLVPNCLTSFGKEW